MASSFDNGAAAPIPIPGLTSYDNGAAAPISALVGSGLGFVDGAPGPIAQVLEGFDDGAAAPIGEAFAGLDFADGAPGPIAFPDIFPDNSPAAPIAQPIGQFDNGIAAPILIVPITPPITEPPPGGPGGFVDEAGQPIIDPETGQQFQDPGS